MAEVFEKMNFVDRARTNPDGSVNIRGKDGRKMTTSCIKIPDEPIAGVDPYQVMMFTSTQILLRQSVRFSPSKAPDLIGVFKSAVPVEKSLPVLERRAKTSSTKMLQLADALMLGMHGFPRDPMRACNIYRAAAWGCSEEEEAERCGIPNGIPQAMIAYASLTIGFIKKSIMGIAIEDAQNVKFEHWISESLNSERGISLLHQVFYWVCHALHLHGWVTPLTLMLASKTEEMGFLNDPRLVRAELFGDFKDMCSALSHAIEYRNKELEIEDMQEKGKLPRGDPPKETLELFKPKVLEIFRDIPVAADTLHVEFKQVPRSPFPMIALAFISIGSKHRIQKIIRLPNSLQTTPFSMESFEYVWLRLAFDIHLGRLHTNERVRPKKITVPDTHGNKSFAMFVESSLKDCDTEVQCVSNSDIIKTGKKSRTTRGQLVSDMIAPLLDIQGILIDDDSADDIVARAQESYVNQIIDQQLNDIGSENDKYHTQEAGNMKQTGNNYFQSRDFTAAVKSYSIALGHMRRVVVHGEETHKLLGTILSNRAACYLGLVDGNYSLEFRMSLSQNAINDCTAALESSWASKSLPESILEKLRFRRDKAAASYDSLNVDYYNVMDIMDSTASGATIESSSHSSRNESERPLAVLNGTNKSIADAVIEYGEVLYKNKLAKNADDGCPICLHSFNEELGKSYAVVLPCGEHALCATCSCYLKIEADKAKPKQDPQCPLCRHAFHPEFIENIPSQLIEKDQEMANLLLKLPNMMLDEKIAVAKRLMWTHHFKQTAVVDALESLVDGEASSVFFRSEGDLTHQQKSDIYCNARAPVEKLEVKIKLLMQDLRCTVDSKTSEKLSRDLRRLRQELSIARSKARDDIYSQMNSVGTMGAELEGCDGLIQVDFHGLHVSEMRRKFKDQVVPILPVVNKVVVITGRGSHSTGKECKLKKALLKLINSEFEKEMYWQEVDNNPGAIHVLWRTT